jgi:2-dehydro-3-deoxyphosphogluconate aldolase/(4S)-4-hydroxy-2-oxoglutarate aldolase
MSHFEGFSLPPVVPLVVIHDPAWIEPLVDAFRSAGATTVEVGLRTPFGFEAVSAFADARGFQVGAGTVRRAEEVDEALQRGATFGLAPWADPDVIAHARSHDWPFIPGAATPTEVHRAVVAGCDTVKIFPASALGGVGFLAALGAVFPDVSFLPTGGVTADNAREYLSLPQVETVSGSWLAPVQDMREGRWDLITARLAESMTLS